MRRGTAIVAVAFLVATLVRETNSTHFAPLDPALTPGDIALVSVDHGAASAIATVARTSGATDLTSLDAVDVVSARLPHHAIETLRRDVRVRFIASDIVIEAAGTHVDDAKSSSDVKTSVGVTAIDAPQVWGTSTGRGVTVALMDTGVAAHPDLAGSVIARVDFVGDGATSLDPAGHGTFLAGVVAAHGQTLKGVAPDAKLVSLRVLDANGRGSLRNVLAAFDWLLRNRTAYNIRVLNLSFGTTQTVTYQQDVLAGVVESAWFAGIVVVVAAGNGGPTAGTVTTPGADPFVVTAGSLDDQGSAGTGDDRESTFSARGPTLDGFAKPDVLAPGEHVLSLKASDDPMQLGYAKMTGTSVASAMVAGIAALVLQPKSSYSPTQVKGAIVGGARKVWGSRTPGAMADGSLWTVPVPVNVGLVPSGTLTRLLVSQGALAAGGASWEGIAWEGISWETLSWEAVSWECVSWESVAWERMAMEEVR
jgi:serine protease AprX